jgi:hypothetical protein
MQTLPLATIEFSNGRLCGTRVSMASPLPDSITLSFLRGQSWLDSNLEPYIEGQITEEVYELSSQECDGKGIYSLSVPPRQSAG